MDSVMKGVMGQCPSPQNVWARTAPVLVLRKKVLFTSLDITFITPSNAMEFTVSTFHDIYASATDRYQRRHYVLGLPVRECVRASGRVSY